MRNHTCFYWFLCVSLGIFSREIHPYSDTSFSTHVGSSQYVGCRCLLVILPLSAPRSIIFGVPGSLTFSIQTASSLFPEAAYLFWMWTTPLHLDRGVAQRWLFCGSMERAWKCGLRYSYIYKWVPSWYQTFKRVVDSSGLACAAHHVLVCYYKKLKNS